MRRSVKGVDFMKCERNNQKLNQVVCVFSFVDKGIL